MKTTLIISLFTFLFMSCTSQDSSLSIDEMTFQAIPKGNFHMGTSAGSSDQQPARNVTISQNFWMAKYELTQEKWLQYTGKTIQQQRDLTNPLWSLRGVGPQHPIYYVSWQECQSLINKLNTQLADQLPKGYVFALPSEAQWEYACQANGSAKPSGDLSLLAWFDGNSDEQCHPVGTKNSNAWGIHDMYGNVWEWCSDYYEHYNPKDLIDPIASKQSNVHSTRGASWHEGAGDCYAAKRDWYSADGRLYNLGLRLAIVPRD
ncbi:formylglycine-generating enzyme family protein [Lentisphaera profundi]|uniref:Formylglycine-generating enzyme family protein n=1 Tax=Lentisphaera profundi TaxID=1658616 RepID=A0ABY7VPI4_9BACT|nr:formylglycine-generating enzyme family protein [Lentisphaera profundi]WDE96065.1 formylglycine-generating enzyme family protein [Lentisphaera profundi]